VNGELAQMVALAVHGSAWLGSGSGNPPTFAGNSAFQFVRSLEFSWVGSRDHGPSSAKGTAGWLEQLRGRGGRQLLVWRRPIHPPAGAPSYQLAGFANGGEWALHGKMAAGGEAWSARWLVDPEISLGRKPAPADQRIWDVHYEGEAASIADGSYVSLSVTQARLESAIRAAYDFAQVEGWTSWAEWLGKALEAAGTEDPPQPYHQDLLLPSTPRDASRLLATASQAWVFGGMGWWNDQYPEQHTAAAFDAVTAALYDAVLAGIVGAANAAATAAGAGRQ
jgi:hypothetical protein